VGKNSQSKTLYSFEGSEIIGAHGISLQITKQIQSIDMLFHSVKIHCKNRHLKGIRQLAHIFYPMRFFHFFSLITDS